MPKSKALIFDIDGTIDSPTQKLPTSRLISSIRVVEDQYYVCAATGRPWPFAQPVIQGMGLIDPCIVSGGTQICNPRTGEVLWQCNIEAADVEAIKEILLEHPDQMLVINDFSEEEYFKGGVSPGQFDINQEIFFVDYVFVPDDVAAVIADKLKSINGITCSLVTSLKDGHKDIHITNSAATKEHAITELLTRIDVDSQNTWGFGDALNDIHLFNSVHTKVAMGNAAQELKDQADEVIAPVTEDGLALYFERLAPN